MKRVENDPDYLNSAWKFFASVNLTVVLLLSLAATSIIGTIIPQNEAPGEYMRAFGDFFFRLFSILDLFDMYHSWWFRLLICLLTLNIVVCSIERLSRTWKIIFPRSLRFNIGQFTNSPGSQTLDVEGGADRWRSICCKEIGRRYRHVIVEEAPEGFILFAEKGRWTRLGAYVVHLSIVLLLAGGLVGSMLGFEGYLNLPEGSAQDTIRDRKTGKPLKIDFAVRCDDFNVSFYKNGTPEEFRSSLTLLKDGVPVYQKDIIVNDPLRYEGINIFQSSYGVAGLDGVTLAIRGQDSELEYRRQAKVPGTMDMPEGQGKFHVESFLQNAAFRGHAIGPAVQGRLVSPEGVETEILLPLRFPTFDRMRKGKMIISVVDQTDRYYTGLQVTHDPGVWIVYLGFIILILGCFITFFISHERICVEILNRPAGSRIRIYGKVNKNRIGMKQRIAGLRERLERISV